MDQQGEFDWDTQIQGLLLGSFYYGFTVSNIPGSVIADKYGAKWSVGMGVLCTSILTLLTPVAAAWGVGAVLTLRILSGIASGTIFPGLNVLMSCWIPKLERSRTVAFIYNGMSLGTVVSSAISGVLCESKFLGGWPSAFYVFGIVGCVWFVLWTFLVYDSPDDHPHISKSELEIIHNGLDNAKSNKGPTPWLFILTSAPVWAIVITQFGISWIVFTLLTELPTYLHNILHFKLQAYGALTALPYLLQMAFASVASFIADKMRASGIFRITTIRKIMNSIGCYAPSLLMLAVIFAGCDPIVIVVLLSLCMGFNGFEYSGNFVTNVDMSPEFSGTLMGLTGTATSVAGILAPLFAGCVIKNGETLWNWNIVFITASAINLFVGTIFNIFASAELQPWGSTAHLASTQPGHRTSPSDKKNSVDN